MSGVTLVQALNSLGGWISLDTLPNPPKRGEQKRLQIENRINMRKT